MSVTFTAVIIDPAHTEVLPEPAGGFRHSRSKCLCVYEGEADVGCWFCQGSGIEEHSEPRFELNLSNANARALLRLLGIECRLDLGGEIEIAEARRAVMRARAMFERRVNQVTREEVVVHGQRREVNGVVEFEKPVRMFAPAFTSQDVSERLERFAAVVHGGAEAGATHITFA